MPAIPLDVLRLAEDFCMEVGLSCSVRGFEALTAAISLGYLDPTLLKSRDRRLFPAVAEAIHSPCCSKSIRRRIDFCIDSAFARNRGDITYKYFKNTIQPDKGKPTVGEFLFVGVRYIRDHLNATP